MLVSKDYKIFKVNCNKNKCKGNITEEDFKNYKAGAKAKDFETLQTLMLKEQALSMLMDEVSKIIFQPVQGIIPRLK